MQDVFDPPEMEGETEAKIGTCTSITNDVVSKQDLGSSYQLWGNMKFEEHGQLLSQAKRDLSRVDYQARPVESNYVTDLRSHAYSEDPLPLGREYYRQKSRLPTSSCSWKKSSALEAAPSSPDALVHELGKMRTKTNTLSNIVTEDRADLLPFQATTINLQDIAMRWLIMPEDATMQMISILFHGNGALMMEALRYQEGCSMAMRSLLCVVRSMHLHAQANGTMVLKPHCSQEDMSMVMRSRHFLQIGATEIKSLCALVIGSMMLRHMHHQGTGKLLLIRMVIQDNFFRINTNEQAKVTTSKHAFIKPRMVNRVANSSDHYRTNMKANRCRNPEAIMDQVRGPRANKSNDASASSHVKDIMSPLVCRDQFNRLDFPVQYKQAKFFMIKSYSEDDIHKGVKYNVWASTPSGNNKLDAAYHDAQISMKENGEKCPVFLFFSVNTSGQFVGLAEMLGPVDFKKTMDFWKEDKWSGFFPIIWHIIKDIPNWLFRHIILEYNDNRPVTFSRDTQEIGLLQGVQMLKIFKDHSQGTSILDDFDFYEEKDNARCAQKRENSESTHQFSEDLERMGSLEASMENWSLYDNWD